MKKIILFLLNYSKLLKLKSKIQVIINIHNLNNFFRFHLFLERGKGGRKKGTETLIGCLSHTPTWGPATQACALTGSSTGDLSVCRPMLNPLSYTSQGLISTI